MTRLTAMQPLAGKTENLSLSEFRASPGEVILQVQLGKTFHITKLGKVVAVLAAPEPDAFQLGAAARKVGKTGY